MRHVIVLFMVLILVSSGAAQTENRMGMFFAEPYVSATTNFENNFAPFFGYVVLLDPTVDSVGGYEVGIEMPGTVFVLAASGPNGWTNFGNNTNHLCGYQTPLPVSEGGTVLASLNMLYTGSDIIYINYTQAEPPSIPGVPVIADGSNPDIILPCNLTSDGGFVATINGPGILLPGEEPPLTVDIYVDGDTSCRAGTDPLATLGYDPGLDIPAAAGSRLHFPHPEWAVPGVTNFDEDFHPTFDPFSQVNTWTFEVVTELSDPYEPEHVQIAFVPDFDQFSGIGLNLVDRTAGITLPVLDYLEYNYQVSSSETRVFDLMVGNVAPNAEIEVGVSSYVNGFRDLGNIARTFPGATDDWDGVVDIPEPAPFPGDYINATFYRPSWPLGPRFRADTQESYDFQNVVKTWPLRIESDQSGTASLIFSPNFHINDAVALSLYEPATGETINLFPFLRCEIEMTGPPRDFEFNIGGLAPPAPDPSSRSIGAGWSMVSLPLNPRPGATLGDVLLEGATGFSYIYGLTSAGDYELLDPLTPADRSRGYWLGTTEAYEWQMDGNFSEELVTVDGREGWNLVPYPVWFPASVSGLRIVNNGTTYTWDEAVAASMISPTVYGFANGITDYEIVTSFQSWNGYWIRAFTDGLEFVFDWQVFQTAPPLPIVGGDDDLPNALDWRMDLTLRSADGPRRTVRCGVHPDATQGFDNKYDKPEPPLSPSGSDLSMHIARTGDQTFGARFRQELTSPNNSPYSWTVTLRAPAPGVYTLTWDRIDWPMDFDLQIYRPDHNRVLVMSMLDTDGFEIDLGTEPVTLEIRTPNNAVGVGGTPAVTDQLTVAPNPFNPATTFALDLSRAGDVRAVVYNVRGQRVSVAPFGHIEPGRHEVTWHARDERGNALASGVYFAAIERDGQRVGEIVKLSLVR